MFLATCALTSAAFARGGVVILSPFARHLRTALNQVKGLGVNSAKAPVFFADFLQQT